MIICILLFICIIINEPMHVLLFVIMVLLHTWQRSCSSHYLYAINCPL